MDINLSAPIWAIEHVAVALHLEVDTAREYTSSPTFPAPKAGFARHLWLREEVLDWFRDLRPKAPQAKNVTAATTSRRLWRGGRAFARQATGHSITSPGIARFQSWQVSPNPERAIASMCRGPPGT